MKRLPNGIRRLVLVASIVLNLLVAIPAATIFLLSDGIRFYLYELVAGRVGDPEIVFIGDSITRDGGIWGMRIGQPLFEVRNFGHAGIYTEQMIYQARSAVEQGASLAFVMAGINDQPKTPDSVDASFTAYVQILDILRESGVEPVIQSTLYRENGEDGEFVARLNEHLYDYAKESGIAFLDLNEVLASDGRLKAEFSRDGTHLTESAYRVWAQEIRNFLKKS